MMPVQVKPEPLRWACERSPIDALDLSVRLSKLGAWISREARPKVGKCIASDASICAKIVVEVDERHRGAAR